MMMTHRIVLKTHPLLTTHVRSVRSILLRCLINDGAGEIEGVPARGGSAVQEHQG